MSKRLLAAALVCVSAAFTGCKGELSPEEVADTTAEYTAALVGDVAASQELLASLESLSALETSLGAVTGAFSSVPGVDALASEPATFQLVAPAPAEPVAPSGFVQRARAWLTSSPHGVVRAGLAEDGSAEEPLVDERAIAAFLREVIFTKENLESASRGTATFLVGGDDLCPAGSDPVSCDRAYYDAVALRLEVTRQDDDGLDVTFRFGSAKSALFTLELRKSRVAVVFPLAQAVAAARHLEGVDCDFECLHDPACTAACVTDFPAMGGVVAFQAVRNGPGDLTLSAAVREAVTVASTDGVTGAFYGFATAARDPVASVRLEAGEERLTVEVDLGRTDVSFPYEPGYEAGYPLDPAASLAGRQTTYTLGGVHYEFTIDEANGLGTAAPTFTVSGLGLGLEPTTLAIAGVAGPLHRVALNEAAAFAQYDVTVSLDGGDGLPVFTFAAADAAAPHAVDLAVALALAPLANDEPVPAWARSQSYRLEISNGARLKPLPERLDAYGAVVFPGAIEVLSGSLVLRDGAGYTVEVGETFDGAPCLFASGATAEPASFIDYFTAAACR